MTYFECFVAASWMLTIGWFAGAIYFQNRNEKVETHACAKKQNLGRTVRRCSLLLPPTLVTEGKVLDEENLDLRQTILSNPERRTTMKTKTNVKAGFVVHQTTHPR